MIARLLDQLLSSLVLVALAGATTVVATAWLVREKQIEPFGRFPRTVRRLSDPLLKPIEAELARRGRNPLEGPLWLLGVVIVGGVALITVEQWLVDFFTGLVAASGAGMLGLVRFVLGLAFNLLLLAIVVRVVAGWVGAGRQAKWSRPFFVATDWLVVPIHRRLPPLGQIDVSPLAAYIVVLIVRSLVFSIL